MTYYKDVAGNVKEQEGWIKEYLEGEISLWDLKELVRVIWNAELQQWRTC